MAKVLKFTKCDLLFFIHGIWRRLTSSFPIDETEITTKVYMPILFFLGHVDGFKKKFWTCVLLAGYLQGIRIFVNSELLTKALAVETPPL